MANLNTHTTASIFIFSINIDINLQALRSTTWNTDKSSDYTMNKKIIEQNKKQYKLIN